MTKIYRFLSINKKSHKQFYSLFLKVTNWWIRSNAEDNDCGDRIIWSKSLYIRVNIRYISTVFSLFFLVIKPSNGRICYWPLNCFISFTSLTIRFVKTEFWKIFLIFLITTLEFRYSSYVDTTTPYALRPIGFKFLYIN